MTRPHAVTERALTAPILQLDIAAELARLRAEGQWKAGRRSITIAKTGGLRVVLLGLVAGATIDEHVAPGAITVHVVDGRIELEAAGVTHALGPGQVLVVAPQLAHRVRALADAAFLLTLAQPADSAGSRTDGAT